MCFKEKLTSIFVAAGKRYNVQLPESSKFARGVGHYLTLPRSDGGRRFMIFPNMYFSRLPARFPNLVNDEWPADRFKRKYQKLGILQKSEKLFRSHMSSSTELFRGPSYYKKDGLIFVEPYYAISREMAREFKHPGLGITIREYCEKRFSKLSPQVLDYEMKTGLIAINLQIPKQDEIIREGDVVTRMAHFHEKPILDSKLEIIYEDEKMVVVNKPSSWPVHPCGGIRMNSLTYIMAKTRGFTNLRTIHRLDRPTSGVLIFAKDRETANSLSKSIKSESTKKEYLALVHGEFPEEGFEHISPLSSYNLRSNVTCKFSTVEESVFAQTNFKRIKYDEKCNKSLILCQPVTGRTHQIRLHLKELGHPVVYDTLYGSDTVIHYSTQDIFALLSRKRKMQPCDSDTTDADNEKNCKQNCNDFATSTDKKVFSRADSNSEGSLIDGGDKSAGDISEATSTLSNQYQHRDVDVVMECGSEEDVEEEVSDEFREFIEDRFSYDPNCPFCRGEAMHDPTEPMYFCLHSYRYKIDDKVFTAPPPDWAKAFMEDDQIFEHLESSSFAQ